MDLPNQITELTEKFNSLEKLYEQVNQQVFHKEMVFWTVIFGVFTIVSIALYFIAESMVRKGVERGISTIKSEYDKRYSKLEEKIDQQDKSITNLIADLTVLVDKEMINKDEFGEWTPFLLRWNHEYSKMYGRYYKTRDIVTLWVDLSFIIKDENSSGDVSLTGLPFSRGEVLECSCSLINYNSIGEQGEIIELTSAIGNSNISGKPSNLIPLMIRGDGLSPKALKYEHISKIASVSGTIVYKINR